MSLSPRYTAAAMRRFVLVVLLLILPIQWSWAAVASVCRHETGSAAQHLGHHQHQHKAAGGSADTSGAKTDGAGPSFDADCAGCQGHASAGMFSLPDVHQVWPGGVVLSHYVRHVSDHVPDSPLRPPRPTRD